jgi:hypothetical protein
MEGGEIECVHPAGAAVAAPETLSVANGGWNGK